MSPGEIISVVTGSILALTSIATGLTVVVTMRERLGQAERRLSLIEEEQRLDRELRQDTKQLLTRLDERMKYLPCVSPRTDCPESIGGSVRT